MQRAARYIRVSTDDQVEFSPQAQKKALLAYAKTNDLQVATEYIFLDEGFSGRKAEKRPAFMRMISTAKLQPKPFDVILVHKFDRFARSREDSVVYKSLLKKECDVRVVSITEQLEDDKFSIILESMLEAMAEYYSLNLSEEVTKGMTEKATRGGLQAQAPFGYRVQNNILVVHEDEAKIVRYIYKAFVETPAHSLFQLARKLNALGYRTKRGNAFETRTVKYILRNPAYIGMMAWTPGAKKDNNFQHPDTIVVKGQHEAIIGDDEFQQVQLLLDEQQARSKPSERPSCERKHWLSGIVKCNTCGASLVYNGNKKYPGFQCRNYAGGKCAVSHSIRTKALEDAVLQDIQAVFQNNKAYLTKETPRANNTELAQLKSQLQKIETKLARTKEAYLNSIDSLDDYQQNKTLILQEKSALEKSLADHTTNAPDENAFKERLDSLYQALTNDTLGAIEKSNMIHEIIDKMIYDKPSEELKIYYYI